MAATTKNQEIIEKVKLSEVPVPWCDEFEKMISGMNFKSSHSEVMLVYKLRTKKLLKSFNDDSIPDDSTLTSLQDRRMTFAKQMMGKISGDVNIEPVFFCTWGCNIFIGESVYINRNVSIYDSAPVTIGDRVLIGPGVCICTDTHEVDAAKRRESCNGSLARPIRICDDCWIGAQATILPGVTIGRGCTVAAGAVVAKDLGENCLVGGVPARVIRKLKDTGQAG